MLVLRNGPVDLGFTHRPRLIEREPFAFRYRESRASDEKNNGDA